MLVILIQNWQISCKIAAFRSTSRVCECKQCNYVYVYCNRLQDNSHIFRTCAKSNYICHSIIKQMDNIQLRYLFDRIKEADNNTKKGLLNIEVRISGTNKRILISTGIHLFKNQFSDRNGFKCRNHNNAPAITGKVVDMYRKIEAFAFSDKCRQLSDIKAWDKSVEVGASFIDFMKEELRRRNYPALNTAHSQRMAIRKVEAFGGFKYFADLTYQNLLKFDTYMRRTVKMPSSLNKVHVILHSYIREAVRQELITKDPYASFTIPAAKFKEPVYLTSGEVERILKWEPGTELLQQTKDMFIVQCFTGLAFVDMQRLSGADIMEVEGRKVIKSNRKKTDSAFILLLLPEAEKVLERYNYRLPRMAINSYNQRLKLVGKGAGIEKVISSHSARHTFAVYLINKGVSLSVVSKTLGHSSLTMTQRYAQLLSKTVIDEMSKLL
ncbi:Tyrosine recombinase XerD [Bacteroidales bacterium Barb4]|nr:Tyrosine recombinase XerD [Bacteroidales bacterium Barb4]